MIPAPRRALEQAALVRTAPFQLPWTRIRLRGRPVIGDELLLQYALRSCSVIDVELTLRQARELLVSWKAEQEAVTGRRDEVILAAVAAGLSKSEICRITGVARTTIDRILDSAAEGADAS